MVDTTQNLYEFISSDAYGKVIEPLARLCSISIYPRYDEVLFKFDERKVIASQLDPVEIKNLILEEDAGFLKFCQNKLGYFKDKPNEQEHPKGESIEKFDQNEKSKGYSKGILISYAIEFLLAKTGGTHLSDYLKKERIPFAKKYEKEIISLIKS